jgi:hypothetical protein
MDPQQGSPDARVEGLRGRVDPGNVVAGTTERAGAATAGALVE